MEDHHPILAQALRDQLRGGRGHRPDPRIRIRHQLVHLFVVRGRYFRSTAGRGRHPGLFPGKHVLCRAVLRLEPRRKGPSPDFGLDGSRRVQPLGTVDPGGQRLDAGPRRDAVQSRNRPKRDDGLLGRAALSDGHQQVFPYGSLRFRHGRRVRGRGQFVPLAQKEKHTIRPAQPAHRCDLRTGRNPAEHVYGRRLRTAYFRDPTDETGRRRRPHLRTDPRTAHRGGIRGHRCRERLSGHTSERHRRTGHAFLPGRPPHGRLRAGDK